MSKNHKGNSRSRIQNRGAGKVQVAHQVTPFRVLSTLDTDAAGYTSAFIDCTIANLGPRALAQSQQFEYWRFKSLRVRTIPAQTGVIDYATNGGVGYTHGVGFSPFPMADVVTTPGSYTDLAAMNCFDLQPGNRASGFRVPSGVLNAIPLKWARTRATSAFADELSRGVVYFLVNLTVTETTGYPVRTWVELSGDIELSGQIAIADTVTTHPDGTLALDSKPNLVNMDEKSESPESVFAGLSADATSRLYPSVPAGPLRPYQLEASSDGSLEIVPGPMSVSSGADARVRARPTAFSRSVSRASRCPPSNEKGCELPSTPAALGPAVRTFPRLPS
jgi:hypothetical protein